MRIYMQVSKVNGDATDDVHAQWSELLEVNFGVHRQTNPQMTHGASNTPLAATFSEVEVVKRLDSLGPQLFEQVASVQGTKIDKVQIDVTTAGNANIRETYIFKSVVITSFKTEINETGAVNKVTFSYGGYDYSSFSYDSKNVKQPVVRANGLVGK